ncbi:hypothetical protein [Actinomadura miaoliensis]|uniref:nSTAND1 domain-containing NTPase n=1 Tax=Actinomadura miaoliensis TaxID=430685 RepID=UPI003CD08195
MATRPGSGLGVGGAAGEGAAETAAFITALHAAATVPCGPADAPAALVVIAVRGDFVDRCADHQVLAAALQDDQFVLGPMSEPDLRLTITGPATAGGLEIEDGLTDTIVPSCALPQADSRRATQARDRLHQPARAARHHHPRRAPGVPRVRRAGRVHPRTHRRRHPRGLAAAKARGRVGGRPTVVNEDLIRAARDMLPQPRAFGHLDRQAAGRLPGALYNHIPDLRELRAAGRAPPREATA